MNVRLRKVFEFAAGVVYENKFLINHYTVTVKFTTVTSDAAVHGIAYERMCYWIDQVLFNSILISDSEPSLQKWLATEQRVIVLPEVPIDQIVGMLIYSKFNAIVEEHVIITDVEISSSIGDEVAYLHSENEHALFLDQPGWWKDPKPSWSNNNFSKTKGNKVIKLNRVPEWKDLELDFDSPINESQKPVVFVDFTKNDQE